jgi:L-lactate utilization protein LutB
MHMDRFIQVHRCVITPQLMGLERLTVALCIEFVCACREVCPVKIDIPRLLRMRGEITENAPPAKGRRGERFAFKIWRSTMKRQWLYELSAESEGSSGLVVKNGTIGKSKVYRR